MKPWSLALALALSFHSHRSKHQQMERSSSPLDAPLEPINTVPATFIAPHLLPAFALSHLRQSPLAGPCGCSPEAILANSLAPVDILDLSAIKAALKRTVYKAEGKAYQNTTTHRYSISSSLIQDAIHYCCFLHSHHRLCYLVPRCCCRFAREACLRPWAQVQRN